MNTDELRARLKRLYPNMQDQERPTQERPTQPVKRRFKLPRRPTQTIENGPTQDELRPTQDNDVPMRQCGDCGLHKPIDQYETFTSSANGKAYTRRKCKVCIQRQNNTARQSRKGSP